MPFSCLTREEAIDSVKSIGATVTYLGIYIGFIFLMSSAVLLAIQQLTKSTQDQERFKILYEIGATRKMI